MAFIPFKCPDKLISEQWYNGRKPANIPSPHRALIVGQPSCGKTCLILNLIINQDPAYDEVYVCHLDAEHTKEYDELQPTMLMSEIPPLSFWNNLIEGDDPENPKKRLCVLDDIEWTKCGKDRLKNLAELLRYASSHKGISVLISHQSIFDTPSILRKMCDVFCIFKPRSRLEVGLIENRTGLKKGELDDIFNTIASGHRDFITIDHTIGSPFPKRLGLNKLID